MNDLNKTVLIGRLTRDAELKYTNGGLAISRFSIAVNRSRKTGDTWTEEADFFDCVQMGKGAEALAQYMTRGKQVGIEGELHQNRWEQDGVKRSKVEVFVQSIQLLGGGKDGAGSSASSGPARSSSRIPAQTHTQTADDGFDDDIPF